MTPTTTPRLPWRLKRGKINIRIDAWKLQNGSTLWTPGAPHAVGDVVKVFPDLVVIAPGIVVNGVGIPATTVPGLFMRCTIAGASGAISPPVPSVPGVVVVDGGAQWITQADDGVPVDNTGWSAEVWFRAAPDAATVDLKLDTGVNGGVALGGASSLITIAVTQPQFEILYALWTRGFADLRMLPPGPGAVPFYPYEFTIDLSPSSSL